MAARFASDSAKRTSRVVVHFSVSGEPDRSRIVLQCRESTDGGYSAVDTSYVSSGNLVDVEPGDRRGEYRVVLEGSRGLVIAHEDLGRVG